MTLVQRINRFIQHLFVLTLMSLTLEQFIFCVFVNGYLIEMLISPVFWALESLLCFMGLRRFNQLHPQDDEFSSESSEDLEDLFEYMERDSRWEPLFDSDSGVSIP